MLVLGCGSSDSPAPNRSRSSARDATATTGGLTTTQTVAIMKTSAAATARAPRPPRPVVSPGSLPQTSILPSTNTADFRAQMRDLWQGIRANSLHAAMPAFFPEGAYAQLKAIGDPRGDYLGRLVSDYELDIGAAHGVLGAHAGAAQLLRVDVPETYAHWVPPGVCENSVGYFEVPNSRIVYLEDGNVGSFGIASMISWRGVWYVIHLGAILRSGAGGEVDDPQAGPGTPVYLPTC